MAVLSLPSHARRKSAFALASSGAEPGHVSSSPSKEPNRHEQDTRSRCRHRSGRPDRLQPPLPYRHRRDAGQGSAGHPSTPRNHARPGRAQGCGHGARRLRVPASRRNRPDRRSERRVQGRGHRPAGGRASAQQGHGARRSPRRQRRDLHGSGQGSRRGGQALGEGAGGGQSCEHERLHRDEVGAGPFSLLLHGHVAARSQPVALAAGREDREAGGFDQADGGVGQSLGHPVSRLPLRHHRRRRR